MPILELYSKRDGIVQKKAGLNWGFSDGHVCIDDAYIAITTNFIKNNPDFFPPSGTTINVIWDDGTKMLCMVEGTQVIYNQIFPKQLSSAYDKSIIGLYLRKRLGIPSGTQVRMEHLNNYGRNYIEILKIGQNTYKIDFHV
ncbi:MAG: hypothetical protein ACI33J_09700 [Clostridium sp.]